MTELDAATSATGKVLEWIKSRKPDVPDIDLDTDLITQRLIDSLSLVEFIFLLEELSGKRIDMQSLQLDQFRTLRRVQENFLGAEL
jgi:acyl carrier protein